ncbi:MAG: glycoside hydrolase family 9 protein [Candidatus Fibromonas sp.]|nr:glycoside hydrolase family 9 protein [Candidatus Fibromonas sp.]
MGITSKAIAILMAISLNAQAAVWLRINQAGYTPDRIKTAIVLSDTDIAGHTWKLKNGEKVVLSGKLGTAKRGDNYYVAQPFYYIIDFTSIKTNGTYSLELAGARTEQIRISADPYSRFATQALMHLRAMRSRHSGDGAAMVYEVKGDWKAGAWQEATPRRTLDMLGGHYDAGDYIKFTLNEAYLAWHLLTAYQENPSLFAGILDEAKYGLDYLAKTFPDENTFVIQVGDARDHEQGWRLPEADALNGKRPALCALSRVHMGSAAAALALGGQVFQSLDSNAATLYANKAKAIYARARKNDTHVSAFERDKVNDFYFDKTDSDNMALAAAELFRLTRQQSYLDEAKAYAPEAGYWVSWGEWNSFANHLLAKLGDAGAKNRMLAEVLRYEQDNLWNAPNDYTWGTLHRWIGMANAHLRAQRDLQGVKNFTAPFLGVLDYAFGRNNWGMAMVASPELPYSIRNIYNGIYRLTGAFPVGALSEGPGDKATHDAMKKYFGTFSEYTPLEEFNTAAAVFYDNSDDFMIQESTIGGQGDFILMLALASANAPPRQTMSRGPASLFINRNENLFIITPAPTCKADSLSITDYQGRHIATLYRNELNQYVWNTRHIPAGVYSISPSDGSPPLTVKK